MADVDKSPAMQTDERPAEDIDLIEMAITERFGERCEDFDAECMCCRAWRMFDDMTAVWLSARPGGDTQ